jgi:hypothetical protein
VVMAKYSHLAGLQFIPNIFKYEVTASYCIQRALYVGATNRISSAYNKIEIKSSAVALMPAVGQAADKYGSSAANAKLNNKGEEGQPCLMPIDVCQVSCKHSF